MAFDKTSVAAGEIATLTWSSTTSTKCTASGDWQGAQLTSGSQSVASVAPGNYIYNLFYGGDGGTASASARLTVNSATGSPSQIPIPAPGPAAPCVSNCYYVDSNLGSDQNNGTSPITPFLTLQKAANTVGPGATVVVASGIYTDPVHSVVNISTSGTSNAWIRFIAGPGQHPVVQIPHSDVGGAGFLVMASYIEIDGFEVIGQNQSLTSAMQKANPSSALFNEYCIGIMGNPAQSLPHDVIIRNNVIHDCSAAGIGLAVGDSVTIAYNKVYNNAWYTDSSGISLYHLTDAPGSTASHGYKNFILGNVAWNNNNNLGTQITDGNGIIIDDNLHTWSALGSKDPQYVPYNGRTYVANNVVYGNGGKGVHAFESAHIDFVNNTSYNNLLTPSIQIDTDAYGSCYDVNIVNNIAVNLNGKQVDETDNGAYSNNLWWGTDVPMLGINDLKADPVFVNPAKNPPDFTPTAGSPALGSGIAVFAPATDIAGNPRNPLAVDRGAIQVTH